MSDPVTRDAFEQAIKFLSEKLDDNRKDTREQIQQLRGVIDTFGARLQSIEINTTQNITQLRAELDSLKTQFKEHEAENAKEYDALQVSDISMSKRVATLETSKTEQDQRNKVADDRNSRILTLQYGAIASFLSLALVFLWDKIIK